MEDIMVYCMPQSAKWYCMHDGTAIYGVLGYGGGTACSDGDKRDVSIGTEIGTDGCRNSSSGCGIVHYADSAMAAVRIFPG